MQESTHTRTWPGDFWETGHRTRRTVAGGGQRGVLERGGGRLLSTGVCRHHTPDLSGVLQPPPAHCLQLLRTQAPSVSAFPTLRSPCDATATRCPPGDRANGVQVLMATASPGLTRALPPSSLGCVHGRPFMRSIALHVVRAGPAVPIGLTPHQTVPEPCHVLGQGGHSAMHAGSLSRASICGTRGPAAVACGTSSRGTWGPAAVACGAGSCEMV